MSFCVKSSKEDTQSKCLDYATAPSRAGGVCKRRVNIAVSVIAIGLLYQVGTHFFALRISFANCQWISESGLLSVYVGGKWIPSLLHDIAPRRPEDAPLLEEGHDWWHARPSEWHVLPTLQFISGSSSGLHFQHSSRHPTSTQSSGIWQSSLYWPQMGYAEGQSALLLIPIWIANAFAGVGLFLFLLHYRRLKVPKKMRARKYQSSGDSSAPSEQNRKNVSGLHGLRLSA